MLNALLTSSLEETLKLSNTLLVVISALLLGYFISFVYMKTNSREGYSARFASTLIMLPCIIAVIILLVGNNVARSFSLAGAFSLIRFRSAPGDPMDIAYVFFTLSVGLACGMGYIVYATIFALILCLVMVAMTITRYGMNESPRMQLKITIPEDIEFKGLFDDIFNEYLSDKKLVRVKTTDFGSLFELVYSICMVDIDEQKEFIDKLRCRNGNLNIVISSNETDERVYS